MDRRKAIQIIRRLMLPVKISYDINHKHESRAVEREIAKDTAEALKMAIAAINQQGHLCGCCAYRREYEEHDRRTGEYVVYAYCTNKHEYKGDDWYCADWKGR